MKKLTLLAAAALGGALIAAAPVVAQLVASADAILIFR